MTIRQDTDELITFLNSLAEVDSVAMGRLISARVEECNAELANHPSVQVWIPGENIGHGTKADTYLVSLPWWHQVFCLITFRLRHEVDQSDRSASRDRHLQ